MSPGSRLAAATVCVCVSVCVSVALAEVTVKLEAGSESDSNVHRTTTERGADEAATGARAALRLSASLLPFEHSSLRLSALAAGKLFFTSGARSENVGVLAGEARWDVAFGRLAPGLRVSYYDTAVAETSSDGSFDHDFRTGAAAAALTLRTDDDHRIEATAGARLFTYKPDSNFDFAGAVLGISLGRRMRSDDASWELAYAAGYTVAQRAYRGKALANVCPQGASISPACLMVTSLSRADLFHDLSVEASYTGDFIVAARYSLQLNDSNSFGQSLLRHRLELSVTALLFAEIYANAKLVLVVNQFLDALLLAGDVGTFVTIEDEARNGVIVHLTRDLSPAVTAEARYSFYANPFASAALEYRRHTLYLGLVYTFGP